MAKEVLLKINGPLAQITLNRPEVLNAMNLGWTKNLYEAVQTVACQEDVRVVLIKGKGRAFCSGIDLDMLDQERMPEGFYEYQEKAFRGLEVMDKVTIAALHGYCLGGGLQLAISCDIRVCADDCKLGLPAVLEGLFPALATFRLPRLIGLGHAKRLILSGEQISPQEALNIGLVDYVVPAKNFDKEVKKVVDTYLKVPKEAAKASKKLMERAFDTNFWTVYSESLPLMEKCLGSEDVRIAGQLWQKRKGQN